MSHIAEQTEGRGAVAWLALTLVTGAVVLLLWALLSLAGLSSLVAAGAMGFLALFLLKVAVIALAHIGPEPEGRVKPERFRE